MKLLTIRSSNATWLGVKTEQGIIDVPQALQQIPAEENVPQTMDQLLQGGDSALDPLKKYLVQVEQNRNLFVKEEELTFGPAIPNPGKIVCIGLNYRKHAEETKSDIPEYPILFNKFGNAVAAHGDTINLPAVSRQVDYEAELVIVIGKRAKRVTEEDALNYVIGYTCGNDLSARDLQRRTGQWMLGKTCDGFCPLGPYLVTADEVGNPDCLSIASYVNGERRQNSNTADMIFSCSELVSYISQHMTLEPGDIILTGTPEGVMLGYPKDKRVWIQDGDEVAVEIEKLGKLSNRFRQEI